jgi:hypothetical protein
MPKVLDCIGECPVGESHIAEDPASLVVNDEIFISYCLGFYKILNGVLSKSDGDMRTKHISNFYSIVVEFGQDLRQ